MEPRMRLFKSHYQERRVLAVRCRTQCSVIKEKTTNEFESKIILFPNEDEKTEKEGCTLQDARTRSGE